MSARPVGRLGPGAPVQQLHLVGVTTEHDSLIFSVRKGAKSGSFVLPLDENLVSALADAIRRRNADGVDLDLPAELDTPSPAPRRQSHLSPREIQDRLRAGRSLQEIAAEAGVGEEWVARFAAPVEAERSQIITRARELTYAKPRRGESAETLGMSVRWNLAERGVRMTNDEFTGAWSGYQVTDETWMVTFDFVSRQRQQVAEWEVDLETGDLVGRNRLASDLGYVEPGRRRRSITSMQPTAAMTSARNVGQDARAGADEEADAPVAQRATPAKRRPTAKKATPAKKVTAKRATVTRKATAKKATATKKAPAKRAAVAKKVTAKKATAKKATAKKATPAQRSPAGRSAAAPKRASARRTVAKAPAKRASATKKSAPSRGGSARASGRAAKAPSTARSTRAGGARKAVPAGARGSATKRRTAGATPKRGAPPALVVAEAAAPVRPVPNELGQRRLQLIAGKAPPPAPRGAQGRPTPAPARPPQASAARIAAPRSIEAAARVQRPDGPSDVPASRPQPSRRPAVGVAVEGLDLPLGNRSDSDVAEKDDVAGNEAMAEARRIARREARAAARQRGGASVDPSESPNADDRVVTIRANRAAPPRGEAEIVLPQDLPPLRPAQPATQPRKRLFGRTGRPQ